LRPTDCRHRPHGEASPYRKLLPASPKGQKGRPVGSVWASELQVAEEMRRFGASGATSCDTLLPRTAPDTQWHS